MYYVDTFTLAIGYIFANKMREVCPAIVHAVTIVEQITGVTGP